MTTVGEHARFVATAAIRQAVAGRETEVLDTLGIDWRAGRPHITCPYPGHDDSDPSWRWDPRKGRAYCTCIERSDSALDVLMRYEGLDFETAKVRAAELIGRTDLIRENEPRHLATDASSLLRAPADRREDGLPVAYLAHRLGVTAEAVPIPSTPMVGLKALGYYGPPALGSKAKPKLVGEFPCAVFGTVAADGRTHAHRIYLAPGGADKQAHARAKRPSVRNGLRIPGDQLTPVTRRRREASGHQPKAVSMTHGMLSVRPTTRLYCKDSIWQPAASKRWRRCASPITPSCAGFTGRLCSRMSCRTSMRRSGAARRPPVVEYSREFLARRRRT